LHLKVHCDLDNVQILTRSQRNEYIYSVHFQKLPYLVTLTTDCLLIKINYQLSDYQSGDPGRGPEVIVIVSVLGFGALLDFSSLDLVTLLVD